MDINYSCKSTFDAIMNETRTLAEVQTLKPIFEDDFSIKIRIKFLLSPIHEHMTLLLVKRLQLLHQFQFVRM